MKVIHVIRSLDDRRALTTAFFHGCERPTSILLLQDAVLARVEDFPGRVYACTEDAAARGRQGAYEDVTYEGIVELLFKHDKVICW